MHLVRRGAAATDNDAGVVATNDVANSRRCTWRTDEIRRSAIDENSIFRIAESLEPRPIDTDAVRHDQIATGLGGQANAIRRVARSSGSLGSSGGVPFPEIRFPR